ncbi:MULTISPECIES: SLC13 family permease [unclassified Streptomyces]|uniref:SLC13 family permease n=1 Tax=unclassified Streptomyces TaxID=2593676 RepID=UPI002252E96B|nr:MULTISPECIES: SLC13 family permease [unclassified Streptomyces]MCX4786071.1 SLC13 family permease [Streptomyces sp. NBC_01221]WSP54530.1 SLC13 family permease [Streptomyces sp. NBC_01241]WSP65620.1 SLC13 family permease [Streptomyces sp. NBC_01240]
MVEDLSPQRLRTRLPKSLGLLHPLDWLAGGLLVLGVGAVATGLLPADPAAAQLRRIGPLLVFLASVIVLAELTGRAQVFDVVATWVARAGRGRYALLFGLCVLFASLTTLTLNLDTTAVLLTPVMLALATRVGIAAVPLAMTTVWLANTASLLLPVSNLTNLLAADRVALSPSGLAAVMWLPQLVTVGVTAACLWAFYWRRGRRGQDRYTPPSAPIPGDPVLLRICSVACAGFLLAILLADVPLWAASTVAMLIVVAAFARRRRAELRLSLVPWRLLVLVPGMFLVVETVNAHGLHALLASALGSDDGWAGMLRSAGVGAGVSNVLNNLPAYVAGEAVVPAGNHRQLLALLIGVNAGPVITPWASLATLLWFERCRWHGTRIDTGRFVRTGLVLSVTGTAAATCALALIT